MPKFPATDDNVLFKCQESAAAHCKISALVTILAVLSVYVFWLSVALLLAAFFLASQQSISALVLLPRDDPIPQHNGGLP